MALPLGVVAFEVGMTLSLGVVACELGMTLVLGLILEVAGTVPFGLVGLAALKAGMAVFPEPVA